MTGQQMHLPWWPLLYGTLEVTTQQVLAAVVTSAIEKSSGPDGGGHHGHYSTTTARSIPNTKSTTVSTSFQPFSSNSPEKHLVLSPQPLTPRQSSGSNHNNSYASNASMSSKVFPAAAATTLLPTPSSAASSSASLVTNIVERTINTVENVSNRFSHSPDAFVAVTPGMTLLSNFTWSATSTTEAAASSAVATNVSSNPSSYVISNIASDTDINVTASNFSASPFSVAASPSSSPFTTTMMMISTSTSPPSVDSYLIGMAWPKALVVAIFMLLILVTVVGNTLVILSVLTTRRLRTVTNCFVLNLAITDWLVGTCVMPPAVMVYIVGSWPLGWILCDIWISLDVLLCTASILSLCAISLDRYLAVTQPLTYSKNRRTKRLALLMIFIVWVTALSITCPPYLGWYEPGRRVDGNTVCRYNQNKGYVVFSAMGSFFIPLAVMLYVYLKIGYVLTSRRQRIVRDANSERTADHDIDCDNFLSESEHFQCGPQKFPSFKSRWTVETTTNGSSSNSKQNSLKCSKCNKNYVHRDSLKHQASFYELVEISRLSTQIPCTSINCKYGDGSCTPANSSVSYALAEGRAATLPMQQLHCSDSRSSFSETCLAHAMAVQSGKYTLSNGQLQERSQQAAATLNGSHHPHAHHHHHHHHHRVPMRVSTTKRDTKTAKTLTMVMGGFIACWLPFFVYYLLIPFLPPAYVSEGLMSFLTWVGWVNCAINPFIYAFYNPDFRTAFWRLTCKRICKQRPPPNHVAIFRG
ncbi:putative tyramine receptor 2 [Musca vetustissima]|uniref:putative tyramine receptor 2 n=1 Tax=Musca vetustissima TaxID=27455 RepID=UPI002AB652FE|nr:putative tyramine receptor 2 [Musca vetustissima]